MSSHRTSGSARRSTNSVKAPRFGPEWYKRRRLRTRRRVAAMPRRRRIWRRFGIVGTWGLASLALVLVAAVVGFYALSDVKTPDQIVTDQTATVLYSDGSVMARIGSQNRTDVSINQVPDSVKWAMLAAEDRNFYSNPGFSVTGTLRAAYHDLTGSGTTQGGSGITQQYVKNAYLSDAQTISRKLKELAIAVKLNRNYSKNQILEYYLNTIYFGRGAYGIQAASQTFFGVDVSKLNVAQAAVLAALVRAPSYYDPAANPTAAKGRWNYVLDGMVAINHLSQAQRNSLQYPTVLPPGSTDLGATGNVGLIVNQVKAELAANGISESTLNTQGLTIQTTIVPKAQTDAVNAINTAFGNLAPYQANIKKALVAEDPNTGAVLAYWGGVNNQSDYHDYAGSTCQGPGSSFKPYTLAVGLTNTLQNKQPGYSLNSVVNGSTPQKIGGVMISNDPSDIPYSSSHVTVARAMEVSLNTVFDGMAYNVGPSNVATMAHSMGIAKTCGGTPTLVNPDGTTNFGIGIGDYNVRTIDQATGFATIANGGVTHQPYFITKVTAADGSVLYQHKDAGTRSIDPRVANDLTISLEPVARFSLNPLAGGRQSASKTGTVGIQTCKDGKLPSQTTSANGNCANVGQNSDAWTVGFTPSVSVAVWAGSGNRTDAIYSKGHGQEYGRDLPGLAWKQFLDTYLQGTPNQPLPTKMLVTGGQNVAPTYTPPPPTTYTPPPPTTYAPPPPTTYTPPPPTTYTPPPPTHASPTPSTPPPVAPPTPTPVITPPTTAKAAATK